MARDTSPTERRGYERPPIGDDWADAWDGLVEDSDELAVERGPIADRPSTGAYDDALYLAVDQRTLWRWDAAASDWEAAAGLGTASDPVPGTSHFESLSTEQTISDDLTLYRVYADGSQTVVVNAQTEVSRDSSATVALQAAIDDINAGYDTGRERAVQGIIDGGGVEFSIPSEIVIKRGVKLQNIRLGGSTVTFDGWDGSVARGGIAAENVFVQSASVIYKDIDSGAFNSVMTDDSSGLGMLTQSCIDCSWTNCGSNDATTEGWRVNANGDSGRNTNASTFTGCAALDSGGSGWDIGSNVAGNTFTGCTAESNSANGIDNDGVGNVFLLLWLEDNAAGVIEQGDSNIYAWPSMGQNTNIGLNAVGATAPHVYGPVVKGANKIKVGAGTTDAQLWGLSASDFDSDGGTRSAWDGVVGGGPLGGVDLSTTTGQYDGQLAVANGSSTAADGAWGRWNQSTTAWDYVDPTGTV